MTRDEAEQNNQSNDGLRDEMDSALGDLELESLLDIDLPQRQPETSGVKRGTVVAVHGEDIFVDMGGKSQGIIAAEQFADDGLPSEGDTVEVTIEGYNKDEGLLMLSRKGAIQAATWEKLDEGQIVEARVTGHNKGGLELDINGIKGFMPVSHIELFHVEDLHPYLNQKLKCMVSEVRRSEKTVVASRREMLRQEEAEARQRAFETLSEGDVVKGSVKTIMPYGAFVDIGGVDGLLHISDMSHSRIDNPEDVVKVGQTLELKVLKIDQDSRKIGLGLKQVLRDPWEDAEHKWPVDSMVTGRVTKLMDFGAFVELEPGVEGLVPISEMSFERRIKHPSEVVREGDMVQVRVLDMDLQRKRMSLSIKRTADDPWQGASVRWAPGSSVEGKVTRLADFGAFVELTPGVEGLVHISEMSNERVRSPGDVVKEGQSVKVNVIEVDEEKRRISLTMKETPEVTDWQAELEAAKQDDSKPKKKRKKPLKGGLDWGF